jgi:hypothetical protein
MTMYAVASATLAVPAHAASEADRAGVMTPARLAWESQLDWESQDAGAAEGAAAGDASEDKSGTDPTKFLRSVRLTYEYAQTPGDASVNTIALAYVQPFAGQAMNLRFKLPVIATDLSGEQEWGLGDFSVRYNWLAEITPAHAWLLGAELTADTATEDAMGRGKWILSPLATYAMFLSKSMIFAPTYQHNFSVAGDDARKDVHESVFDFYFVYTAEDKQSWVTVDPTLGVDWEGDQDTPFTIEVQLGRRLGTLWGGAFNAYIQPGAGIGQDRPYDWNIEIGVNVTGF